MINKQQHKKDKNLPANPIKTAAKHKHKTDLEIKYLKCIKIFTNNDNIC